MLSVVEVFILSGVEGNKRRDEMRHAMECKICGKAEIVNGQRQIDEFKTRHQHGQFYTEYMTGHNFKLNNEQTRIDLGLDKKPCFTGSHVEEVHDYWRKIGGREGSI